VKQWTVSETLREQIAAGVIIEILVRVILAILQALIH
jgi:hypothetical protein